jgi:hypothetical protein
MSKMVKNVANIKNNFTVFCKNPTFMILRLDLDQSGSTSLNAEPDLDLHSTTLNNLCNWGGQQKRQNASHDTYLAGSASEFFFY